MSEIMELAASIMKIESSWVKVADIAKDVVADLVKAGIKSEQQQIALQRVLGTSAGSQAYLSIRKDATNSPFSLDAIYRANKALIDAGVNAQRSENEIVALSKAIILVGGDSEQLIKLSSTLGDIYRSGYATKMQLREFSELGIDLKPNIKYNAFDTLSESITGKGSDSNMSAVNIYDETTGAKLQKLKNNWQVISSDIGRDLRPLTNSIVDIANETTNWLNTTQSLSDVLHEEQDAIQTSVRSIMNLNMGSELRAQMIENLKTKYPDLFANLDKEKTQNLDLFSIMKRVNAEYEQKIRMADLDAKKRVAVQDANEYMDIARKMNDQAAYDQLHPFRGPFGDYKYFGIADRIKAMRMGVWGLKNGEGDLSFQARWAESQASYTQNQIEQINVKHRQQELINIVNQANDISKDPAKQNKLWGKLKNAKHKEMITLMNEWNTSRAASHGMFNDDLLNGNYYTRFLQLLNPVQDRNIHSASLEQADNITDGGRKQMIININAPMYKVDRQEFKGGSKEGLFDFEQRVEEVMYRILNSLPE